MNTTPLTPLALAASLVGLPWQAGAAGPQAFNCWGLVRHWCRLVLAVQMPDVPTATPDDARAHIAAAAQAGGWRPLADGTAPAQHDIALLRNPLNGQRHVGVLLQANGALNLLHCEGSEANPWPGVVCEPLAQALCRYHGLQLWRRA